MTEHQARTILELPVHANRKQGYNRYRYLLKKFHPDKGGSTGKCQHIIAAWDVLKELLPSGLPVVTLMESETSEGEKIFFRWAKHRIKRDGSFDDGVIHTYTRIKSNVYVWCDKVKEFYPRFREEDKILHDGKNCEVVLLQDNEKRPQWAEWTVPWM